MDGGADSDHSMSWEDFFGSTSDLAPTLLGIYDSLLVPPPLPEVSTSAFERDARNDPPSEPKLTVTPTMIEDTKPMTPAFDKPANKSSLYPLRPHNFTTTTNHKPKTELKTEPFENLSSNVKRMISSVETANSPLKLQKKTTSTVRASTRRSNIPLVGATSKIAQSRVGLVPTADIYDQPCGLTPKMNATSTKLKPDFNLNSQETYDVPTNNQPVSDKTAFESLSLPYIDQSIDTSSTGDREFDTKLSSAETTPQNPKPLNLETIKGSNGEIPTDSSSKKSPVLLKSEPYPDRTGSTGNLKVDGRNLAVEVSRPLSMSSIVSSSSSSSGVQNKGVNSAYLASIESLDDHSDDLTSAHGSSDNFVNNAGVKVSYEDKKKDSLFDSDGPSSRSQLERVCAEILHTEEAYVQDLQEVVEGYLHVWRDDPAFSEVELAELFNNIENIYNFNRELCSSLRQCSGDARLLARCLVAHAAGFAVYTDYCTGYPRTMQRLAALASRVQFRERQSALGHSLPLASYLLKPVQRILKYHLLLQKVVKQCSCEETVAALRHMTDIAQHIDHMKRRHEQAVRVQEIQSLLYGWNGPDLTTYGELCAEGTFRVSGARGARHLFLFDGMLLITKLRERGQLAYKSHVMCNNMMLVESISGAALSFHVIPWDRPRALLTLQASSPRHKREWTLLLKRVILENYNAVIPTHARQLVMQLGQNKTDDDILAEKSHNLITQASTRKQLSAPEYLEKRKLDRERRQSVRRRPLPPPRRPHHEGYCSDGPAQGDVTGKGKHDPHRSKLAKIGTWRRKSEPHRCEDVCRNCGAEGENGEHEETVMSDPETDNRKRNCEIKQYNTKHVPKKISKLKKNRAKAKFYADLSFTEDVLHISESKESLNGELLSRASPPTVPPPKDEDIDEETYKKLIEKTDSFKKNELEKVKFLNKQKVIDETDAASGEEAEQPLEHIISQLLMQNREFQKLLKKQQHRSANQKRHGILLKSYSYPEKTPKSPTRKISDAFVEIPREDDDHIYETLRVDNAEQTLNSSQQKCDVNARLPSPPKLKQKAIDATKLTTDSDYVYLTFNKSTNEEGIYDVPIKMAEKQPTNSQDYYVTMDNGKENIEDLYDNIVYLRKKQNSKEGEYLPMSPETNVASPNTPEIWLSHQKEHFNVPRERKSGSLPRSFQVNNQEDSLTTFKSKLGKSYLNSHGKVINAERPYTIASEQGEIGYESVENYISEENIKFNKSKLKEAPVQVSQSTLDLEEEIDRCYKNNFEANFDKIDAGKLNVSEPNLTVSSTSSREALPERDERDVIHPEHRVYKPNSNILSLKNVLSRFKGRSQDKHSEESATASESSPEVAKPDLKTPIEKRSALNPRSYSKNLLQRFRSIIGDEHDDKTDVQLKPKKVDDDVKNSEIKVIVTSVDADTTSTANENVLSKSVHESTTLTESHAERNNLQPLSHSCDNINHTDNTNVHKYDRSGSVSSSTLLTMKNVNNTGNKLPIYMQGSKHLGARIAQSDYADPKTFNDKPGFKPINVLINKSSLRPDSLLSNASYVTNSSDGVEPNKPSERATLESDESFYEKTFEKIEKVRDEDVFRDSAVYSDQEEDSKSDKKRCLAVEVVKRNSSFKTEHVVKTTTETVNSQTRITLTSQFSQVKSQTNNPKPKIAPPIPAKPKITHLPTPVGFQSRLATKTLTKTDNCTENNVQVKRNVSVKYTRTESVESKQEQIKESQTFTRQTTERASLDSAMRKTKPDVEMTKSVLERRLQLESLTKDLKPKPAFPLTKKPSQLVKPKVNTSKVTPYERSSNDFGNVAEKNASTSKHIPAGNLKDKIDEESKGSWVKTVVNKFQ